MEKSSPLNWLKHFPYETARKIQSEVFDILEKNWDKYSAFVIVAPTAFGKSSVAKTLLNSQKSVSYLTPTNLLIDQFREEFPDTPTLSRLDSYQCKNWMKSCSSVRGKERGFCKGCPASKDLARAKYRKGPGAYNYHIFSAHKIYRDVVVIDEAHNLIPHIREKMALRIWQHDYLYPHDAFTNQQLLAWFRKLPKNKQNHKKMVVLEQALMSRRPKYVVSRAKRSFNGKGTLRGLPEERDCIELLPVDISAAPKFFWPKEVKKLVLLSATINEKDIEALGLGGRERPILYLKCKSPIPASNRPIVVDPIVSVNRNNMIDSAEKIASYIETVLLPRHGKEKGVIHATYQMSQLLEKYVKNDRFIFHGRMDKKEKYQKFVKSNPEDGKVLVACGMYEGIDLPEDLGRWQVISKIPWMSLGSPAVKYQAEQDPEHYLWETMKVVVQAAGRICRTPEDYGITYILDGTFDRLFLEGEHLLPEFFKEALMNVEDFTDEK